jgi:hypothetical protein
VYSVPVFSGVRVGQSLVFSAVLSQPLFVFLTFFRLDIVFSVLRFETSNYTFDALK